MRKIVILLVLTISFVNTSIAQKKGGKPSAEKMLQKMTIALNLSEEQQSKIKPLLASQIAERIAFKEKRKAMMDSGEKPSKLVREKMKNDRMASETAMTNQMASILDEEQFAKFEAIEKEKKEKAKMKREEKEKAVGN